MNGSPQKRHGLSKSRLIAWRQCPKRLWLEVHHPGLRVVDAAAERRFAVGHQVGALARDLETGGLLIEHERDLSAALAATREAMATQPGRPLFEPAFQHDGLLVRIDLLLPGQNGYRLVEVKSTGSLKDYHLPDAAIQAWVANQSGLQLEQVCVAHLDTSFEYPGNGDYRGLFYQAEVSEAIRPMLDEVPHWFNAARDTLQGDMPHIAPGEQCTRPFNCPFQAQCLPTPPDYPVMLLPDKAGKKLARQLAIEGYADLRQVPADRLTTPLFQRIHQATLSGEPFLDPAAAEALRALPYPRFYLDFEAIGFPIPIWPGTRPFEALPFQWSCHIETRPGVIEHADFLDTTGEPPMRRFAESLIATLGMTGTVFVYSGYEKTTLNALASRYPDLAIPLRAIVDRLYDLLPLTKAHYYHPAMKGSWSIKEVLPTVTPDLDYGSLGEVQDGTAAQYAYMEIIDPAVTEDRRLDLAHDLRDYCRLDTLALVRLAQFIAGEKSHL